VRGLGDPDEQLERFLTAHGAGLVDLLGQVDDSFGHVEGVVAGGSVPVGYATSTSDLDLYVIVDNPEVTAVPVVSHELGFLIDIFHIDGAGLRSRLAQVADENWCRGTGDEPREEWEESARALDLACRLALGAVVRSSDQWDDVRAWLRDDWLIDRTTRWWRLLAWRNLAASRWLREVRPALAIQTAIEGGIAALKAMTSAEGLVFTNEKWVPRELRALARDDLTSAFRSMLLLGSGPPSAAVAREVEQLVAGLLGPAGADVVVEIAYLPAVERWRIGDRTVVWRWDMNGLELEGPTIPDPSTTAPIWRGPLHEEPPLWVRDLFAHGLAWMGTTHDRL
jgi:hypothetical protein